MKTRTTLGRLLLAVLLALLAIAGLFFLFWLNKPKENNTTASQQAVASVASSSSKKEDKPSTDKKSEQEAYAKADASFEEKSRDTKKIITAKDSPEESSRVFDISQIENQEHRVSIVSITIRPQAVNAINANTAEGALSQELWNARVNPGALILLALQHGYANWVSEVKEWKVVKGGTIRMSEEANSLYQALETDLINNYDISIVTLNEVYGTTSGLDERGEPILDSTARNWSGWLALKKVNRKTGKVYYTLFWCGNGVWPTNSQPNIPRKDIPVPTDPPKEKTPPSSQTPPPSTTTVPKKAEEAPLMPQGGGKVDDSNNPPTSWVEPPAQYIAPEAPKPSEQTTQPSAPQGNQGGSGSVTPPSNWEGSGGFSDPNGRTDVGPNGSLQTPGGGTRPVMAGQDAVVPSIQNGGTTNQGDNNGGENANDVPMED